MPNTARGPGTGLVTVGPAKVNARKSILFTEDLLAKDLFSFQKGKWYLVKLTLQRLHSCLGLLKDTFTAHYPPG